MHRAGERLLCRISIFCAAIRFDASTLQVTSIHKPRPVKIDFNLSMRLHAAEIEPGWIYRSQASPSQDENTALANNSRRIRAVLPLNPSG